jgi:hypothetical protein
VTEPSESYVYEVDEREIEDRIDDLTSFRAGRAVEISLSYCTISSSRTPFYRREHLLFVSQFRLVLASFISRWIKTESNEDKE